MKHTVLDEVICVIVMYWFIAFAIAPRESMRAVRKRGSESLILWLLRVILGPMKVFMAEIFPMKEILKLSLAWKIVGFPLFIFMHTMLFGAVIASLLEAGNAVFYYFSVNLPPSASLVVSLMKTLALPVFWRLLVQVMAFPDEPSWQERY